MQEPVDMNLVDALVNANFWQLVEGNMQEPKKYTAKEAMHWMLDNPYDQMVKPADTVTNFMIEPKFFRYSEYTFQCSFKGTCWRELEETDNIEGLYIKSEYDVWQESLKQQQSTEPMNYAPDAALNWMKAHPGEIMKSTVADYWFRVPDNKASSIFFKPGDEALNAIEICYGHNRTEWIKSDVLMVKRYGPYQVYKEWDKWADAKTEKEKPERTEPKEGESLEDYRHRPEFTRHTCASVYQKWIESYVQREIRKAIGKY